MPFAFHQQFPFDSRARIVYREYRTAGLSSRLVIFFFFSLLSVVRRSRFLPRRRNAAPQLIRLGFSRVITPTTPGFGCHDWMASDPGKFPAVRSQEKSRERLNDSVLSRISRKIQCVPARLVCENGAADYNGKVAGSRPATDEYQPKTMHAFTYSPHGYATTLKSILIIRRAR